MNNARTKLNPTMFRNLLAVRGLAQRNQGGSRHLKILSAGFIALSLVFGAQAQPVISSQPGYTITWDGNDGDYSGLPVPDNAAKAGSGSQAFGSGQLIADGTAGSHMTNVNNGTYGNASSWINGTYDVPSPLDTASPAGAAASFIGIRFTNTIAISSIAWGRENNVTTQTGGYPDRWQTVYTLQVTTVANPDGGTTTTGNAATGWVTIGTVSTAQSSTNATFRPWMRHLYNVAQGGNPIPATGMRIVCAWNAACIDEIEVNSSSLPPLVLSNSAPYSISWDGNNGEFTGHNVPNNVALSTNGAIAFGSGQIFADGVGQSIANVVNGLYGNANGWISGSYDIPGNLDFSAGPFIGVALTNTIALSSIAWGRDNTGAVSDRWQTTYTLQVTTVANPDGGTTTTGDATTGWVTIGTAKYQGGKRTGFTPWVRHRYNVSQGGNPIQATGVRIQVASGSTEIDEIELNAAAAAPAVMSITHQASEVVVSWTGAGTLQTANQVTGPWTDVAGVTNPMTFSTTSNQQFYRVKQ